MKAEKIKCPTCGDKKIIKDYHTNNHFKQNLKMSWHESIKCPDCKYFENKNGEKNVN